ncbi:signal transduction protein [Levilactobacillus brevis]|uniref:Signal transduction protein n=2 Tax=Levilactobacillus brevis TaxID=1580 RepID=A0AAJ5K5W8_LEVBR|nr:signal transduction protein [Levilactobacillus brevis]AWP45641.1 signal transduction protein [Levilactobacillus brevis]RAY09537.1 signal transduction protein [Levilactobacillus brevis]TOZ05654.1 signal transduction protein [Levilactobacillus brevis]
MITVSTLSFALADFSMVYWFIYFQYYWFSELVVLKHISLFCFLVTIGYTVVDLVNPFTFNSTPIGSALPVIVLLGFEFFLLGMRHQTEYLPAFIDVSILAYLLVEFIDLTVLALMIWLAGTGFATSLWGTLVELVVNNIVLALVASGLWLTRAPMENLIQSMLGRSTEYLFLAFMSALATVYILFEYSLQSLNNSAQYLFFLGGIAGMLVVGLSLSTYMLMQTHLQAQHTQMQSQQQAFREQYAAELNRQMGVVRKFQHDYQNMLVGLGGYLEDQDYAGFRQLYIDIRSGWETSNAADLTVEDLENVPSVGLRFQLYHNYLLAQRAGVQLYVQVPEPLTATVTTVKKMGQLVDETLPKLLPVLSRQQPALVTFELRETAKQLRWLLTFPVPKDARLDGQHRVTSKQGILDFSNIHENLPAKATSTLQLKLHWGQLIVALPKSDG